MYPSSCVLTYGGSMGIKSPIKSPIESPIESLIDSPIKSSIKSPIEIPIESHTSRISHLPFQFVRISS